MEDVVSVQKSRAGEPRLHCTHQCNAFVFVKKQPQPKYSVCACVVGLVFVWKNCCCVKNPRKCCRGSDALQRKHAQNLPGLNGVGGYPGRIVPGGGVQRKGL